MEDDILTFDELLTDEYYKSEFEKRVQERLDINNPYSGVNRGEIMDNIQKKQGENPVIISPILTDIIKQETITENPAVKTTESEKLKEQAKVPNEPLKGFNKEQFELYNETLKSVSKAAKAGLNTRYNAFEDAEVKAAVKAIILENKKPNSKDIAADVVKRLASKEKNPELKSKTANNEELIELKAELALVKGGITPERLEAAKKLFLSEGGDVGNVDAFVAKYPEWQAKNKGVTFSKAPPAAGKTAPAPNNAPILNDFERKVATARKARGLPY